MNNTLEGINSRITESEEWINDLEDRMMEITAIEQQRKKNGGAGLAKTLFSYLIEMVS